MEANCNPTAPESTPFMAVWLQRMNSLKSELTYSTEKIWTKMKEVSGETPLNIAPPDDPKEIKTLEAALNQMAEDMGRTSAILAQAIERVSKFM